ncbi:hypothetical protein RCL_jg6700.t1 [Rhizophagus clarus]|uniref:Uncharacterized protein n=1 Tax=Rhizophagus clarus TaxID=94130 RepID=A0A8H3LC20_9GLOM|nr:hypothetical protein RCL_jg6700.t1 [Rhizophagus clarus]
MNTTFDKRLSVNPVSETLNNCSRYLNCHTKPNAHDIGLSGIGGIVKQDDNQALEVDGLKPWKKIQNTSLAHEESIHAIVEVSVSIATSSEVLELREQLITKNQKAFTSSKYINDKRDRSK